jgi:hypothetical protein
MTGPHPLWDDKAPSPVKRLRVTWRHQTQLEMAGAVECSLTAYHNLEARGIGSAQLWERVAAVFQVAVDSIKPVSPARGKALLLEGGQLVLPGSSS